MNKLKLFIDNFIVYGIGGVIGKVIPLIMLPIITRIMPDSTYYGLSDMSNTVVQFGSAIALLGMYDAMYRLFFEKDDIEYKKDICSTTFVFTMGSSLAVFLLMIFFKDTILRFVFKNKDYSYLVYISAVTTLTSATNGIVSAPTRMQNKRKVFLVVNAIIPILSYSIAISLLLNEFYVLALPLAAAISGIVSEVIFWVLNKNWFSIRRFRKELLRPLLIIAIPLVPNFLIYWVFNSCDRIMIANLMDLGSAGVYSVGSKLGHTSQLIYTAFAGGWQYFAFSTMQDKNQVQNNSRVFEYLGVISFVCSVFIFALSKTIFQIVFAEEYFGGYIVAPYLFLAPLLQMLFQIASNQFLVVKKTWPNLLILSLGAFGNIVLNSLLIPCLGIEGAAVATLAGYAISTIMCVLVLVKIRLQVVEKKFVIAVVLLGVYIVLWRMVMKDHVLLSGAGAVIYSVIAVILYRTEIMALIEGNRYKRSSR